LNFSSSSLYSNYSNTPLYIFGASYAGHYIPNIANAIITHNAQKGAVQIPLKGIGIGDGWTDPIG